MTAGYSGTPLYRKLGLKEGQRMHFIGLPDAYFTWIQPFQVVQQVRRPPYDFVHVFVHNIEALETHLLKLRKDLDDTGMIWVSWHKKSSGLHSEITEDVIRETALALQLVDVKVCSVSHEWSGLKLVIRKEYRKHV